MAASGPWPAGPAARFLDAPPAMQGGNTTPEHQGGAHPGGAPGTPYGTPLWATPAPSSTSGPRPTGSPDTMASLRHAYYDLEGAISEQVRLPREAE